MALGQGSDGYMWVTIIALQVSKDAVHIVGCSGCGGDSVKSRVEDTLEDDLRPGILWNTTASQDCQGLLFPRQECYLIS